MREEKCCRVIGRIGTTKYADECLLLGEKLKSASASSTSELDPLRKSCLLVSSRCLRRKIIQCRERSFAIRTKS
jgi:hypothetical protein